jgi:hypothetical protein
MTRIGVAVLALMWAGTAWAGCSNWLEDEDLLGPPPHAKLCVGGACEETTLDYSCGNAFGAQWGYRNGVKIDIKAGGATSASRHGHKIAIDRIKCTATDGDACFIRPTP